VGVLLAGAGAISVGGVIAAGFIISKAVGPLRELIEKWEDIVRARMAYDRLDALLLNQRSDEQKMSLPAPKGALSLQGVRAKAPNSSREILKGLDFELPAGSVLAIVGPNAAGKSTLLKLVLGLWKPSDGYVRLDGAEVYDWNHEELGPFIGYVAQKPELFEATVAENIARLSEVDPDLVVEAAQLAGIHDIVLGFPEGYDTILCNGDFELSGGQAQRISIARALYNKPKLVVLDEPNAALDDSAEQQLVTTVQTLRISGTTVVFTSHRPKLISISDYLLVLKEGHQIAFGKTSEMLNKPNPVKLAGVAMDSETFKSSSYSKDVSPAVTAPAVEKLRTDQKMPLEESALPAGSTSKSMHTSSPTLPEAPPKPERKSLLFTEVKA
jgi:ATP-binding cassette, subfamily C, bacterial exporter for protease/lipase